MLGKMIYKAYPVRYTYSLHVIDQSDGFSLKNRMEIVFQNIPSSFMGFEVGQQPQMVDQ